MPRVYIYVVDRDFGFAPNPFHGICSLATCKPKIRNTAQIGDWIIGVGGQSLKATGKCIFAMKVTKKITFNEYWEDAEYLDKKPIRNGSKKMMIGDNIYFHEKEKNKWNQTYSHHSNPDGSLNVYNKNRDTQSDKVLLSKHFYYFGRAAPQLPDQILIDIGYRNKIGHRVFDYEVAKSLIEWIEGNFNDSLNLVIDDPFNFDQSEAHYSVQTNNVTN